MIRSLTLAGALLVLAVTPVTSQNSNPYFVSARVQQQLAIDGHPTGSEPANPAPGWMTYDTTVQAPKYYTGTQWAQLGTGTTSGNVTASTGGFADGAITTQGSKADAANCATGNTEIACIRQLDADVKGPIPAGTNTIGGTFPGTLTLTALDVATTAATAQNALAAGHRSKGGWIKNPDASPAALCINEIGTAATGATSGSTICIAAGQSYQLAPSGNAVSVISADGVASRPFGGYGFQ